jgi:hypothetical protein
LKSLVMPFSESTIALATTVGSTYGLASEVWKHGPNTSSNPPIRKVAISAARQGFHFGAMGLFYQIGSYVIESSTDTTGSITGLGGGAAVGTYLGLRAGTMHSIIYNSLVLGAVGLGSNFVAGKIFTRS